MKSLIQKMRLARYLLFVVLALVMSVPLTPVVAGKPPYDLKVDIIKPWEPGKLCLGHTYKIIVLPHTTGFVEDDAHAIYDFARMGEFTNAPVTFTGPALHGTFTPIEPVIGETGVGWAQPAIFEYTGSNIGKEGFRFTSKLISNRTGDVYYADGTLSFEVVACAYKATIIYEGSVNGITSFALMGETRLIRTGDELHGQGKLVLNSLVTVPSCSITISTGVSDTTIDGKIAGGQISLDFSYTPLHDVITAQCQGYGGSYIGGGDPAELGLVSAKLPEDGGVLTIPSHVELGGRVTLILVPVSDEGGP